MIVIVRRTAPDLSLIHLKSKVIHLLFSGITEITLWNLVDFTYKQSEEDGKAWTNSRFEDQKCFITKHFAAIKTITNCENITKSKFCGTSILSKNLVKKWGQNNCDRLHNRRLDWRTLKIFNLAALDF